VKVSGWLPGSIASDVVVVRLGKIPSQPGVEPIIEGDGESTVIPFRPSLDNKYSLQLRLTVKGVADYLITGGTEILVEPQPGSEPGRVRLFLQSLAVGALLHQRGHLPLHASAVATPQGAVLFAGSSGSGKSTIAAALHQRGSPLMADEICAIVGDLVYPAGAEALIWRDSLEELGEDCARLQAVRQGFDKFMLPLNSGADRTAALPICSVYILESGTRLKVAPLEGLQKIAALWQNTYRLPFVRHMNLENQHLANICGFAKQVRVARLVRPNKKFPINELIEFIERELKET